ncbi:non-contractile tail tubular protein [Enterobacter phage 01_vB_Eclo_IJM]|nr:non-contractile tail tubular protein [Enterobacter phage 01_vB_Eclo_IJM]
MTHRRGCESPSNLHTEDAVPFSEQLLLWSDEVQFVMTSSGVLTAKSIQLDVGSEFALGDNARPFAVDARSSSQPPVARLPASSATLR